MKKFVFSVVLLIYCSIYAQDIFIYDLNAEIESEKKDIVSFGISLGTRFTSGDVANFDNELFNVGNVVFDQDAEDGGINPTIQFSFKYGLDRFIIPGLTFGLKLDYSYITIETDLEVVVDGAVAFLFDDDLLSIHNIGLSPHLELRIFTLCEYFFRLDMPEYFEIYCNLGLRANYNIEVEEDNDLDIENFENFNLGIEFGVGTEFFVSDSMSWRFDFAWYTNESDFDVEQAGVQVFSSELDIEAVKTTFGLVFYF